METAVRIAKIQEQLVERNKSKYPKSAYASRSYTAAGSKPEPKPQFNAPSHLTKERQKRDFCKANNLCIYYS
jgi:hypothetical protein